MRFDWHNTAVCNPSASLDPNRKHLTIERGRHVSSRSSRRLSLAHVKLSAFSNRGSRKKKKNEVYNIAASSLLHPLFVVVIIIIFGNNFDGMSTGSFGEPDARASIIRRYRRRKRVYAFYACTIAPRNRSARRFHFRVLWCRSRFHISDTASSRRTLIERLIAGSATNRLFRYRACAPVYIQGRSISGYESTWCEKSTASN